MTDKKKTQFNWFVGCSMTHGRFDFIVSGVGCGKYIATRFFNNTFAHLNDGQPYESKKEAIAACDALAMEQE